MADECSIKFYSFKIWKWLLISYDNVLSIYNNFFFSARQLLGRKGKRDQDKMLEFLRMVLWVSSRCSNLPNSPILPPNRHIPDKQPYPHIPYVCINNHKAHHRWLTDLPAQLSSTYGFKASELRVSTCIHSLASWHFKIHFNICHF